MPDSPASSELSQTADIFFSYARSDLDLARPLVGALQGAGLEVALDVTHLVPGEAYAERLDALLVASAKVVFLATPASLVSPACRHELDLAARHAKPVLPVLVAGLAKADLPEQLREVQYLRLDAPDLGPRLAAAVRVDLEWERRHAEYERQAAGGPAAVIAHRAAVQEAVDWLAARPAKASPVSPPVRDLIARSRTRVQRRTRAVLAGLAAATLAMAGLAAGFYVQWGAAQDLARVAETQTVLAQDQARLALARAEEARNALGLLYSGEAERLAQEFQTDAALLTLLEASQMIAPADVPRIEATFSRILTRAESERRFTIPGDAVGFEFANTLYYQVPSEGALWRIDPVSGPVRIGDWPGRLVQVLPVTPRDGRPMIAATDQGGAIVLSYIDPVTGRRGPETRVDPGPSPWPVHVRVDIGPDGVGLIAIAPDDMHPDFVPVPEQEWVYRHFAFDVGRGLVSVIGEAEVRVDAAGQSRFEVSRWAMDGDGTAQPALHFDAAGGLAPLPEGLADEDLWRFEDCLARGFHPGDILSVAQDLRALEESDTASLYSEPGYSTPASGHCLTLGNRLVHVGTFGTSGGSVTQILVLRRTKPEASWIEDLPARETYNGHFRPSLLQTEDGRAAMTVVDVNEVVVYQALPGSQGLGEIDPRRFRFPYRTQQAVLSPLGALIALEAAPFDTPLPRLRVTVLDPVLILEPDELALVDVDLPYTVERGPDGPELRDRDGAVVFALPSFVGDRSPMAFPVRLDPVRPFFVTSVDRRTVERVTRDTDGSWRRDPLFIAPRYITQLTLQDGGELLTVSMSLGGGYVEARLWSLADRREVAFLGQDYKWLGTLDVSRVGLDEGRARAAAALGPECRPSTMGDWRGSPCWPGHL